MAFVYKAERNIVLTHTEEARNLNLGPGSYQVDKPILPKNYGSRPPFLTQTGRTGKADVVDRKSQDLSAAQNPGLSLFMNNAGK